MADRAPRAGAYRNHAVGRRFQAKRRPSRPTVTPDKESMMIRAWRAAVSVVVVMCVSAAAMVGTATAARPASPAAAPAGRAGARDASFGKDGKVTVGFPS